MTEEELQKEIEDLVLAAKILDLKIELAQCRLKQIKLTEQLIKQIEGKIGANDI